MAECFITGIAATQDVAELERLLGDVPGLDHRNLSVITTADRSDRHDRSFLRFIHAGGPDLDAEAVGERIGDTTIITGSGGTGVPGIGAPIGALGYLGHPRVEQHVGLLPIPEDEADNYNDALDDGRTVVAYKESSGNCAPIETALRNAGLKHVKTF